MKDTQVNIESNAHYHLIYLILTNINEMNGDISWLQDKKRLLVVKIMSDHGDRIKEDTAKEARDAIEILRQRGNPYIDWLWKNIKRGIAMGGITLQELGLTSEEIQQLKKVF